jgi:hypothetical protein
MVQSISACSTVIDRSTPSSGDRTWIACSVRWDVVVTKRDKGARSKVRGIDKEDDELALGLPVPTAVAGRVASTMTIG